MAIQLIHRILDSLLDSSLTTVIFADEYLESWYRKTENMAIIDRVCRTVFGKTEYYGPFSGGEEIFNIDII
jgi:hypothetical protein